jgi:hypothetical protein
MAVTAAPSEGERLRLHGVPEAVIKTVAIHPS